ncbi:hypothetical protein GGR77_002185 [Xanthomonas translucens]
MSRRTSGVARQKRQDRRHQQARGAFGGVQAQVAGGAVAERIGVLDRRIDLAQRGRDAGKEAFAGIGQRDAAGSAMEQAHAHALFQRGDRMAERRGRHAQRGGGAAKAALLGDGDDRLQFAQGRTGHCAILFSTACGIGRIVSWVWCVDHGATPHEELPSCVAPPS